MESVRAYLLQNRVKDLPQFPILPNQKIGGAQMPVQPAARDEWQHASQQCQ